MSVESVAAWLYSLGCSTGDDISDLPRVLGVRMLDVTGLRYDHTNPCTIRAAEDSRAEAD